MKPRAVFALSALVAFGVALSERAEATELKPSVDVVAPVPTRAETPELGPDVDVVVRTAPPPRRVLAVEWNPVPLATVGKLSFNFVFVPVTHHALVLSPFGVRTSTAPITVFGDGGERTPTPTFTFTGFGSELGYRYYTGESGPRGLFVGPSLGVGAFEAVPASGSHTHFTSAAVAADAGYEAILGERVALGLGAGVQYVFAASSLPEQQFPARIYANRGVAPRFLFAVGWAL
jgi:hypothetical protein